MRRKEKEVKESKVLEQILNEAEVCRLGFMDGDKAYVVPMNYGYREGNLYFHSAPKGKKIELIKANNYVCFQVDTRLQVETADKPCNWSMRFQSIIGYGHLVFLESREDKINALNIIMEKYSGDGDWDFDDKALAHVVVMKLEVESMTGKKSGY